MKPVIYLAIQPERYPDGAVDSIQDLAAEYEVVASNEVDAISRYFDRVEVVFGWTSPDQIPKMPNLKWVQQTGAGADWLERHPEVRSAPITLTNASGVHSVPISEHLLAMLLALARSIPASVRSQTAHRWGRFNRLPVFELAGKRVLVMGVGAIGGRFATLCSALEMEVVAFRRDPSVSLAGAKRTVGPDGLAGELPHADVIANTLPLTAETRHILGPSEFAAMKNGAIVLNIGRGGTIDERAMIDALKSGKLLGAGLDVFEKEPLDADSPLWDMENVVITSHYSGSTPRYNERAFDIFHDNLRRYLSGEPLHNVVDKELGY